MPEPTLAENALKELDPALNPYYIAILGAIPILILWTWLSLPTVLISFALICILFGAGYKASQSKNKQANAIAALVVLTILNVAWYPIIFLLGATDFSGLLLPLIIGWVAGAIPLAVGYYAGNLRKSSNLIHA